MGLLLEVFIQIHVNNGKTASIVFKNLQIPFKSQKRAREKGEKEREERKVEIIKKGVCFTYLLMCVH